MSGFRLVDPERSLKIRLRKRLNAQKAAVEPVVKRKVRKGNKTDNTGNEHGVGGVMPGEARNPTGKGGFENPTPKQIAGRQKILFKPGVAPNPYGRKGKKGAGVVTETKRGPHRDEKAMKAVLDHKEIQELCRKSVPLGIEALKEILANPASTDMAKIAAYTALADRGYGKPTQTNVNASMDMSENPSKANGTELERRIAEALARVERLTGGEGTSSESEDGPSDLREIH